MLMMETDKDTLWNRGHHYAPIAAAAAAEMELLKAQNNNPVWFIEVFSFLLFITIMLTYETWTVNFDAIL